MTQGEGARFRVTRVIHKFIHLATDLEVDFVPFGEISNDQQEIIWSDGNSMSVLGLQEAFLNARVERIDDIELRVLESPAIVALKILAWHERQETKDLVDIAHILQNYQDDDRVFAELYDAIAEQKLNYESAPSALIGRDIQAIFQAQTLTKISECLAQLIEQRDQFLPRLIPTHYTDEAWDEAFESLLNRFNALQYGILN